MNPHTLAVLICRTIALLLFVRSIYSAHYIAGRILDFIEINQQISGTLFDFSGLMSAFFLVLINLNLALLFSFFSERLAHWMVGKTKSDEGTVMPTLLDWHSLALTLIGIYFVITSVNEGSSYIHKLFPRHMDLGDRQRLVNFMGFLFQMVSGVLLIVRSRTISRYLLRLEC